MTEQPEIKRVLQAALDPIEGPAAPPARLMKKARRRRWATATGGFLTLLVLGAATVAGVHWTGLLDSPNLRPAGRGVIAFERLPVRAASKTHGLIGSPAAPPGFPDCTLDMLDIEGRPERDYVSLTVRPREGVQCGLHWWPDGSWTDSSGEVYDPPRADDSGYAPRGDDGRDLTQQGRLLLMGSAAARSAGVVADRVCGLQPPITYSITVAGERVEIGTLDEPECQNRGSGDARELPYSYEMPGLETPMGSLDPQIDDVEHQGGELSFILVLTNDTDETIVVGRCPFYDVAFSNLKGTAAFRSFLNCPAAPDEVPVGEALRFRIVVPLQGVTGEGTLRLTLRDERRRLNQIETEVSVP